MNVPWWNNDLKKFKKAKETGNREKHSTIWISYTTALRKARKNFKGDIKDTKMSQTPNNPFKDKQNHKLYDSTEEQGIKLSSAHFPGSQTIEHTPANCCPTKSSKAV